MNCKYKFIPVKPKFSLNKYTFKENAPVSRQGLIKIEFVQFTW